MKTKQSVGLLRTPNRAQHYAVWQPSRLGEEGSTESLALFAELLVEGSLSLELGGGVLLGARLLGEDLLAASDDRVRVQLLHSLGVSERVDLLARLGDGLARAEVLGDLGGGEEALEVGVRHLRVRESPVRLLRLGLAGAVDGVEGGEGVGGPDEESAEVGAGGELEEVERLDVHELDAGDVAEGAEHRGLLLVDDDRAELLHVAAVAGLALAGSDVLRGDDLLDVGVDVKLLEHLDSLLRLVDGGEGLGGDDQRDLVDLVDGVASGGDQSGDGGRGEGRAHGVSLHADVDLAVPSSPGGVRRVHVTAADHVAVGSLTGSVGAAAGDSRDTGDGATGAPRLGGGLVAGDLGDGVRLSVVLLHVGVHDVDEVRADGGAEDSGQVEGLAGGLAGFGAVDGDQRTSSHLFFRE